MMARILSGKEFAARIKEDAARGVAELKAAGVLPRLAVIIVGSDPASEVYVRNKQRTCEELGIRSDHIALPAETTKEELLACIEELNVDPEVHGILVQLPLPTQIAEDEEEILSHIDPRKDVDGFHPVNVGHLVLGAPGLRPCTPAGCIRMLDYAGIPIEGAHAVIIGRSNIVGKPMAHLLLERNATVTICHSRTQNLAAIARTADILVAAVGRPRFVTADMVKEGATVIDVGINRLAPKKLRGQFSRTRTDIRNGDFRGLLPRKNRIDRLARVAWANSTIGICRVLKGIGHE